MGGMINACCTSRSESRQEVLPNKPLITEYESSFALEDARSVPKIIEHRPSHLLNLGNLKSAEKDELGSDLGLDSQRQMDFYDSPEESPPKLGLEFHGFITPRRGEPDYLNAFNLQRAKGMDKLEIQSAVNGRSKENSMIGRAILPRNSRSILLSPRSGARNMRSLSQSRFNGQGGQMQYLLKPFHQGSVNSFMLKSEHSKRSFIKHQKTKSGFKNGGSQHREKGADLNEMINRQKINTRNTSDYAQSYQDTFMLQDPNIYVLSKCIHINSQSERMVKKYLKMKGLPTLPKFVELEIHLLQELPHSTMPSLFQVFETEDSYALILEPIYGNNLLQLVNQKMTQKTMFKEADIIIIMYQLLSLAKHLHRRKYVVRDFKPESIRFVKENNDLFSLKIMSLFGATKKRVSLNRLVGSYAYMAPQILKNQSYDQRVDVYSLGVILYILMTLEHPFTNKIYEISDQGKKIFCKQKVSNPDTHKVINFSSPQFRSYSYFLQKLCKRMLEFNLNQRISASQAFQTQIIQEGWKKMQAKRNEKLDLTKNKDIFLVARSFGVSAFRKAVFKFVMPMLLNNNEKKRQEYEDLYRKIDLDGDGVLSRFELRKAMKKVRGMSKQDREFFSDQLTKKKGYVTKEDFILSSMVVDYSNDKEMVREIFEYLDTDQSGELSQQELCTIFKKDNQEFSSLQLMLMEDMDINGDSSIGFEEFYQYLMKREMVPDQVTVKKDVLQEEEENDYGLNEIKENEEKQKLETQDKPKVHPLLA